MNCSICYSLNLEEVLNLGEISLCDKICAEKVSALGVKKYPVTLCQCKDCGHAELKEKPPEDEIYSNYTYRTSLSPELEIHFSQFSDEIINLNSNTKVNNESKKFLDIGGNDGVLARHMNKRGYKSYVLDPSPTAKFCPKEIIVINDYLNSENATKLNEEEGKFDIISCNNCIANVRDLHSFADCISRLLSINGLVAIETGYLKKQIESRTIEMINHEHYHYFTMSSIGLLFQQYGIQPINSKLIQTKGGSFRFYGIKVSDKKIENNLANDNIRYSSYEELISFIKIRKIQLETLIQGKKVIGFGSSAGTTILSKVFNLNSQIEYIVDDNQSRHNKYMPGLGAKIMPPSYWYKNQGDLCINFAWRFGDMIRSKHLPLLGNNYRLENIIGLE